MTQRGGGDFWGCNFHQPVRTYGAAKIYSHLGFQCSECLLLWLIEKVNIKRFFLKSIQGSPGGAEKNHPSHHLLPPPSGAPTHNQAVITIGPRWCHWNLLALTSWCGLWRLRLPVLIPEMQSHHKCSSQEGWDSEASRKNTQVKQSAVPAPTRPLIAHWARDTLTKSWSLCEHVSVHEWSDVPS